jgi:hypothetical protein
VAVNAFKTRKTHVDTVKRISIHGSKDFKKLTSSTAYRGDEAQQKRIKSSHKLPKSGA